MVRIRVLDNFFLIAELGGKEAVNFMTFSIYHRPTLVNSLLQTWAMDLAAPS